ncbi:MAG: multiple monosaccharide ABC transporter ATP-binding protein [Christensenellales bacterium]|jgi:putative multiple sugar transport system ATP-binding protein
MAGALLEMRSITKTFPGVKALDNVNLTVQEGEIHAIVGENGAGKSTLMNVLSGVYPYGSYEGDIYYEGQECRFLNIKDSERLGIVIIHQELALVPYLSIGENMFLGNEQTGFGGINWDLTYQNAEAHMREVGLNESARTLIKDIGVGKQQLVEIAKALTKNVKLLILDEPTSALNDEDSLNLLNLLKKFRDERGVTCIMISHKLNEIAYVADKITILRDGSTIETLDNTHGQVAESRIIKGMVGREMVDRFPKRVPNIGEKALEIENWTVFHPLYTERKVVDNVSINVRRGEVVGIAGLIGAGRTELCQSVFGRVYGTKISGTVKKDGQELVLGSAADAIAHGFAYVTEDRKGDGLVLSNSITHNITLSRLELVSNQGIIDKDQERHAAEDYREKLTIHTPDVEQLVSNLSGGNQQKVLVGKWMFAQPDIMMLDEPTRGVDVGAKYEIYGIINQLVGEGKAVLMISSELPELLGMCDRIYVMAEGRIVGELPRAEASQEIIMDMIMQASKGAQTT